MQEAIDAGYTGVDFAALIEVEAAGAELEMAADAGPVDDGLARPTAPGASETPDAQQRATDCNGVAGDSATGRAATPTREESS